MEDFKYVDFHTHLDWYSDEDELLKQLYNFNGIIVSASENLESYNKNLALKRKTDGKLSGLRLIPTIGIHPKSVLEEEEKLEDYVEPCRYSSLIGEIGMDFCWYKEASAEKQEKVLRFFLEHCNKTKKYCVIHTKDAEERIAGILKDYPNAKPIIHWYDGPEKIFKEFVSRGYYQTFGCETIRSTRLQNFLKQMPLDRILAETDNPTSEPWLGGTDNSIFLIKRIYADIAKILNMPLEKVVQLLWDNSCRVLGL